MQERRVAASPDWLKRLGSRIRQARRGRGLTQTDAAGPHLTKSFISLLESGRTYPSVGTLVALASRLQTSLALLLLEESQLPRETALNLLALARAQMSTPAAAMDVLFAAVDALAGDADDLRAEVLLTRGDLAATHGKAKDAEKWCEEALGWARRRRLRTYEPRILTRLAELALARNDLVTAQERLNHALSQYRATRTLRSVEGCEALILNSRLLSAQGKSARALRTLEEVAEVAARNDLPLTLGKAYRWIGILQAAAGRPEHALESLHKAKAILEPVGAHGEFAPVLHTLATLLQAADNLDEAYATFQEALQVQEQTGASSARAAMLDELAQLQLRRGKLADAQTLAKEAFELARAQHDVAQSGQSLITLARVARAQHRWKHAADYLRDAVELFRKAKSARDLADSARELGMLLKERGEHAEAADYLAIALSADRALSTATVQ